jgi:hypothetical protein
MSVFSPSTIPRLRYLARAAVWLSAVGGLLLPWSLMLAVDHFVHHLPLDRAWQSFRLHLFAPGYNLFLVGVLTAFPFIVLTLVILLHLGTTPVQAPLIARRRACGLACAGSGILAVARWTHVDILLHPDAQGALAYFFLPIILLLLLPGGYAVGRLAARVFFPQRTA